MRYILIILTFSLIYGCSNESKKNITPIDARIFQLENSLSPLFDSIRIPSQKFIINNSSDSLILCKEGTSIFINKNTFIDEYGNFPDTIEIEIVEVKTISDILRTNLQTVSDDNILQTGGMLFIDAKSNGKPLKICDSTSIFIESNSKYLDTRMQLYYGDIRENGQINWSNEKQLEKTLIAIPLELLDYNFCSWECWYSKEQIQELKNKNHENTYIASREFEYRMCSFSTSTCDWTNGLDQKIIEIYIDNIDKDLSYSDSLVAEYILRVYGDKIDTTKQFNFSINDWFSHMYKSAVEFSKQKLTQPLNFNELGITDSTSIDELLSKGYTKPYSQKILAQYEIRKHTIADLKNKEKTQRFASYSFEVNKLGWINIDALLIDENMKESDFTVEVNSNDSLKYISLSLVIPDYNVSIFAIHQDSMKFSFTKKQNGYRKLPVNSKAFIVGFSYKENLSYFGKQEIKIPEQGIIKLDMERKTENEIKTEINKMIE
jgi:hypothetical protein